MLRPPSLPARAAQLTRVMALVVLTSCMARPIVTMYGAPFPARGADARVEVFQSQKPDRAYTEIARIEVRDTNDQYSMSQILQKARGMGADGVIILGRSGTVATGAPVGRAPVAVAVSQPYGTVAVAIRFK
ncbi:MAG: hypothetical protein WCK74_11775 [Gemmatimonadaceae bacterium]